MTTLYKHLTGWMAGAETSAENEPFELVAAGKVAEAVDYLSGFVAEDNDEDWSDRNPAHLYDARWEVSGCLLVKRHATGDLELYAVWDDEDRAAAALKVAASIAHAMGGDDLEVDDGEVPTSAAERGVWVQAWLWVPNSALAVA